MASTPDRWLLKLSGEALAGADGTGIEPGVVTRLAAEIAAFKSGGGELAMVVGGGNLFRGAELAQAGMDRVTGDHIGMLATVMNALAVRELLRGAGVGAEVFSAIEIPSIARRFQRDDAVASLAAGNVAIFAAGTGNPFFTTDTAACLRAIEIGAVGVLKGTKVDGVYSDDPLTNPDAERLDALSFDEVLERGLQVMDLTAICLCRDHDMPIVVFDMYREGALAEIVAGNKVGSRISGG